MAQGMRREQTAVGFYFFHASNVEALHTSIRYRVYQHTGQVIDRQSTPELINIMRGVYEDSLPPTIQNTFRTSDVASVTGMLNERVLARVVPDILGAIRSHTMYIRDITTSVPIPLDHAEYLTTKGSRSLELPRGF